MCLKKKEADLCWKTGWNIPTAQADFIILKEN